MATDKYGRTWDLPASELCPTCGQPDNCGDCTHGRLTAGDVGALGGRIEPHATAAELDEWSEAFEEMAGYPPCPACGSIEPDCEPGCPVYAGKAASGA